MDEIAAWCFRYPEKAANLLREQAVMIDDMDKNLDYCRGVLEGLGLPTGRLTPEIMEALKRTNNRDKQNE